MIETHQVLTCRQVIGCIMFTPVAHPNVCKTVCSAPTLCQVSAEDKKKYFSAEAAGNGAGNGNGPNGKQNHTPDGGFPTESAFFKAGFCFV